MAIFTNLEIFLVKLVTLVPVVKVLVVVEGSVVSLSVVVVVSSTVVPVVVFLVVIGGSVVSPSVVEMVPVVGFLVVFLGDSVSVFIISVVEVVDSSVVPAVVEGLEVSPLVVAVDLAVGVGDVGSVEFLILLQSIDP